MKDTSRYDFVTIEGYFKNIILLIRLLQYQDIIIPLDRSDLDGSDPVPDGIILDLRIILQ